MRTATPPKLCSGVGLCSCYLSALAFIHSLSFSVVRTSGNAVPAHRLPRGPSSTTGILARWSFLAPLPRPPHCHAAPSATPQPPRWTPHRTRPWHTCPLTLSGAGEGALKNGLEGYIVNWLCSTTAHHSHQTFRASPRSTHNDSWECLKCTDLASQMYQNVHFMHSAPMQCPSRMPDRLVTFLNHLSTFIYPIYSWQCSECTVLNTSIY